MGPHYQRTKGETELKGRMWSVQLLRKGRTFATATSDLAERAKKTTPTSVRRYTRHLTINLPLQNYRSGETNREIHTTKTRGTLGHPMGENSAFRGYINYRRC